MATTEDTIPQEECRRIHKLYVKITEAGNLSRTEYYLKLGP
jgi:hypothetical protein